jgi:phosphate transport system substrate-binding protein
MTESSRVWARRTLWWVAVLGVSAASQAAWGQMVLEGAGATFPSKVYERWAREYERQRPGVNVRYAPTGSSDGVAKARQRAVQWAGTDAPLSAAQRAEHRLVQIPLVVGGLVPVVNLPGVASNALVLDGPVLAALMLGEITQWNDARVAALNPGLKLPNLPVRRVVRSDGSGSSEVFTRYLGLAHAAFAAKVPASTKPTWPGEPLQAKGNDGLSERVLATPGALGYVSFDRVSRDRLTAVKLRTQDDVNVAASEAAFRSALLASDMYRQGDDEASLLAQPRRDAWPITATSFVLLDATPRDAAKAQAVARFVFWAFMHGDELTRGTGFAPLPERVQARLAGRLMQIRLPDGKMPDLSSP